MDGEAWWATVHGVAKSRTRLSDFTFTFYFHALEKEMATHSSVLAWRIPGTGEPGGLPSMGSHRVGHNWSDLAAAAAWSLKMHSNCTQGANNLSESYCQECTHFIIRRGWFVKGSQELTVDPDLDKWNITMKEKWKWRGRKEQGDLSLETTKNKGTRDGF